MGGGKKSPIDRLNRRDNSFCTRICFHMRGRYLLWLNILIRHFLCPRGAPRWLRVPQANFASFKEVDTSTMQATLYQFDGALDMQVFAMYLKSW